MDPNNTTQSSSLDNSKALSSLPLSHWFSTPFAKSALDIIPALITEDNDGLHNNTFIHGSISASASGESSLAKEVSNLSEIKRNERIINNRMKPNGISFYVSNSTKDVDDAVVIVEKAYKEDELLNWFYDGAYPALRETVHLDNLGYFAKLGMFIIVIVVIIIPVIVVIVVIVVVYLITYSQKKKEMKRKCRCVESIFIRICIDCKR